MGHKPTRKRKAPEPEKPKRKRKAPEPEKPKRKRKAPEPEKPKRKRKAPEPEKPKRKRRRKADKPPRDMPREFERWPSERMISILESVKAELDPTLLKSASVKHHEYSDGTIDGEIKVRLPRGMTASEALQAIQDSLPSPELRGLWISSGVQYTIKEDEMVYRKTRGMNEVATSWQSATRSNIPEVVLIARHTISTGLSKKFRRKAETVFVRLRHSDTHPKKGT